jgi:hypothetical protein
MKLNFVLVGLLLAFLFLIGISILITRWEFFLTNMLTAQQILIKI